MGYMNLKGDTIIPTKYDLCRPFYNGTAVVSKEPDFSDENFDVINRMFLMNIGDGEPLWPIYEIDSDIDDSLFVHKRYLS